MGRPPPFAAPLHTPQTCSSTLHQWSRDDPAFLLEEHGRRARGEKPPQKSVLGYLLESIAKHDPYPVCNLMFFKFTSPVYCIFLIRINIVYRFVFH